MNYEVGQTVVLKENKYSGTWAAIGTKGVIVKVYTHNNVDIDVKGAERKHRHGWFFSPEEFEVIEDKMETLTGMDNPNTIPAEEVEKFLHENPDLRPNGGWVREIEEALTIREEQRLKEPVDIFSGVPSEEIVELRNPNATGDIFVGGMTGAELADDGVSVIGFFAGKSISFENGSSITFNEEEIEEPKKEVNILNILNF